MKPVTVSTTIDRPREEVYDAARRHLAPRGVHRPLPRRLATHPRRPRGVGAGVRVKGTVGPHRETEITVVESTPERIVEHGRSGKDLKRRTTGTYTLAASEAAAPT